MTVFAPESIKVLGSDAGGDSVVLCDMFVDDLADLPAQNAYNGYKLSMGCTATVINDNSRHRINSAGQWVQISAGTSTYTKTEIDSMIARIDATVAEDRTALTEVIDGGAKNLLNPALTDTSVYGVTATINDGVITLNGKSTNSSGSTFRLALYPAGSTQLSGCILSGIPVNSEGVYMNLEKSGSPYTRYAHDTGNGAEIGTLPNDEIFVLFIRAPYNVQLTNFEIKPMICTASDYTISPAFVPYAPTNRQLYELIKQYHP